MRRHFIWAVALTLSLAACMPEDDPERPQVVDMSPAEDATSVAVDVAVTVAFSIPMKPVSVNPVSFQLKDTLSGQPVSGQVICVGDTATFTPNQFLAYGALYTVVVEPTVQSREGHRLPDRVTWTFRTVEQVRPDEPIQLLDPSRFSGGTASVTLGSVRADERVVVIPVHASQETGSKLSFSLSVTGLGAEEPRAAARALPGFGKAPDEHVDATSRHGEFHRRAWKKVRERSRQAQDLRARKTPFGKCRAPYSLGKKCDFQVLNADNEFVQVTASLRRVSPGVYWFVADEDADDMNDADLARMETVFETRALPVDTRYFGDIPDTDGNDKVIVVFTRQLMVPEQEGGGTAGYVAPWDFFGDGTFDGLPSNEGDIFYAVTPTQLMTLGYSREEYFEDVMPGTVVHELKHLIATGTRLLGGYELEDLWLEEPSAVAAEELAGYGSGVNRIQRLAEDALRAPQDFGLIHEDLPETMRETFAIYGWNFLLLWRQAEKIGHDRFWKRWTLGPLAGIPNLETATGTPFHSILRDWALTLLLDHSGALSGYDYQSLNLRDGSWESLGIQAIPADGHVSAAVRSMGYWAGRGQGGDVTVRVDSSAVSPRFLVVRLPIASPAASKERRQ